MRKYFLTIVSVVLFLSSNQLMAAMDHGGKHGKGGGANKAACKQQGVFRTKPAHLADVSPGSEFSFWVQGIKDAETVEVKVKKISVEMEAEDNTNYFLFKGKLPKELVGTVARIHIVVHSKKCPSEKGWLVRIGE